MGESIESIPEQLVQHGPADRAAAARSTFFNDAFTVAVWTSFHTCLMSSRWRIHQAKVMHRASIASVQMPLKRFPVDLNMEDSRPASQPFRAASLPLIPTILRPS